jgi:hypothetical protein
LEFVELDVGEGVMPTTEFTEELMDSDDDLEESESPLHWKMNGMSCRPVCGLLKKDYNMNGMSCKLLRLLMDYV